MSESTTGTSTDAVTEITKGKSQFLTLEYVVASGAVVLAVAFIIAAIESLFSLWTGGTVSVGGPLAWITSVTSGYIGALWVGIAAVALAVAAWVFYARVSRAVAERPAYTGRVSYKVVTYATFAALLIQFFISTVSLITVLLGSLLLIGSESSIGQLYLTVFLPSLLSVMVVAVAGYFVYKIVRGVNRSRVLSLVLLGLASAALLAVIVTVAIRSHDDYSANDFGRTERTTSGSIRSLSDYLNNY